MPSHPITSCTHAFCRASLAIMLCTTVPLHAGEGHQFVEAYNELVRMAWSRADVVGLSHGTLALKNPANASVTGTDINVLCNFIAPLRHHFIAPPPHNLGPWSIDDAAGLKAFPLLDAISPASFLQVPAAYTQNGQEIRSDSSLVSFTALPVLWEQLEDIRTQMLSLRYTRHQGSWTTGGMANQRRGDGGAGPYVPAIANTSDAFQQAAPTTNSDIPLVYTTCKLDINGVYPYFSVTALARGGIYIINGLPQASHHATFYNYACPAALAVSHMISETWDDYGVDNVRENLWTAWGTSQSAAGGSIASPWLGPDVQNMAPLDTWCAEPPDPAPLGFMDTRTIRGFRALFSEAIVEWTSLYDANLNHAAVTDTGKDGIVFVGCDCTRECLPDSDPAWQDMLANPSCRFGLGVSSGLLNGGLRVQAYVSEWYEGGQPRQMLNLDTYARILQDPGANWGFATVRRPSGAEVIFTLKGPRAGQPINGGASYHMRLKSGTWELVFDDENHVVHRFGGSGASGMTGTGIKEVDEVRAMVDHQEIKATRTVTKIASDTIVRWPGMEVNKRRNAETRIQAVNSPVYAGAYPQYDANGELIISVNFLDSRLQPGGQTTITPGSRIFTTYDAVGTVRDLVRIVPGTNGLSEIWRYGAQALPAQREIVQEFPGNTPDTWKRARRMVVLNPDQPDAHSNVTETVLASFPWGAEIIREVVGPDAPTSRITTYAYYTDPQDSNNYSRLQRMQTPDGAWTRYTYDAAGRATERVSPFGDAAPDALPDSCRTTRFHYTGDPTFTALHFPTNDIGNVDDYRPRLEIESVLGFEVARTYHAFLPDQAVTKRCTEPGAPYDATSNLTSVRKIATSGTFAGYPTSDLREDGTLTSYAYAYDATKLRLTTTRDTGSGLGTLVTNGTRTVTVIDAANRVLSERTLDIVSGMVLADIVHDRDGFGRATNTVNRRDDSTTTQRYGCCGVEKSVDAEGIATFHDYTALKQVLASTRAGITTLRTYDSWGNAVRTWTSATNGTGTGFELRGYDDAGQLVTATNAAGYGIAYTDAQTPEGGRKTTSTGANGETQVETWFRDGSPRASDGTASPPVCHAYGAETGKTWTVEYHGHDTNATAWTKTVFDMLGRTTRIEYPDGYGATYTYDALGRQIRQSDGFTTSLTAYNARNEAFRHATDMDGDGTIDLDGPDLVTESSSRYTQFAGVEVRESESRLYGTQGSTTQTVLTVVRSALNGTQTWSVTFGRTNYSSVVRDRASATRTETQLRPDGTRTVATYTNGLLASETFIATNGQTITTQYHTYDALQRPATLEETAATGETRVTRYAYDAVGQVTTITETTPTQSRSTRFEFDQRGQRIRTLLPDGGVITNVYNLRGELAEQYGTRTYPVRYTYDEEGHMLTLATFRNGPAGTADLTTWEYDPVRGWLNAKRDADGAFVSHSYFPNGALKSRRWARGVETTYAYDAAGAVTNVSHSDGTASMSTRLDRRGRPMEIRDAVGLHTLSYKLDGSLLAETLPQIPGASLVHEYDAMGRRTNAVLRSLASDLFRTAYAFDSAGRLASVSDGARTAQYGFSADGRTVTNVQLGAWGRVAKRYDGLNRLLATETLSGTTTLHRSTYTLNTADQRTRQTLSDSSYWSYSYDALGQLAGGKKFFADGIPVGGAQFEYAFDTIGNRRETRNFHGQRSQTSRYTANALNQYTERTVPGEAWVMGEARTDATVTVRGSFDAVAHPANRHGEYFWAAVAEGNTPAFVAETNLSVFAQILQVSGSTTTRLIRTETRTALVPRTPESFTHDADGNLTEDGLWRYTWDAENRLVAMESATEVPTPQKRRLEFLYDHQGRRTRKTVGIYTNTTWSTIQTNLFIYDGWNVISETIGNHQSAVTNFYLWGLDLSGSLQGAGGIGGLVAATLGGTNPANSVYYLYDGNGNITALADTNATLQARYEYGPFGEPLRASGIPTNPFRFSTKYTDTESEDRKSVV